MSQRNKVFKTKVWLVDLDGQVEIVSTRDILHGKHMRETKSVCMTLEEANNLSRHIRELRWKNGFQVGPFDKNPPLENFITKTGG
jgi:hypothetical protein